MRYAAGVLFVSFAFSVTSFAADLPGTHDPSGFKRYEGAQIIHAFSSGYAEYQLDRDGGWKKPASVEGAVNRTVYLIPAGHTALEILRNYEQTFSELGLKKTYELKPDGITTIGSYFNEHVLYGPEKYDGVHSPPLYIWGGNSEKPYYATYAGVRDGKATTVALLVAESAAQDWQEPGAKVSMTIEKGQAVAVLDVVIGATVANKMVLVKAGDMAKTIAATGKIDLYGIYFDVDKSDIKPESNDTLGEIAKLMKSETSLKLEVGGHTDNTGKAGHNLELSQARADAVVKALTAKYGVDAKRLIAKGYGDTKPVAPNNTDEGKAKNRRVQLRKV
jgi:outer membrane protein OmpA-like peptidoglycan-associated protein